jgi:hypothetical protein
LYFAFTLWGNHNTASQDPSVSAASAVQKPAPVASATVDPAPVAPATVDPAIVDPAPVATPAPVAPPEPTCNDFAQVTGTYIVASDAIIGIPGAQDLWPRATIHNGSAFLTTIDYIGSGQASDPSSPGGYPMQADWESPFPAQQVSPGQYSTVDIGLAVGQTVALYPGGSVQKFDLTATASSSDGTGANACPIRLTKQG